jgi:hypothetical protein
MAVEIWPILDYLPRIIAPWKSAGYRLHHETKCLFDNGIKVALSDTSWNMTKHLLHRIEIDPRAREQSALSGPMPFQASFKVRSTG